MYSLFSCNCYWSSASGVNSLGRMVKNQFQRTALKITGRRGGLSQLLRCKVLCEVSGYWVWCAKVPFIAFTKLPLCSRVPISPSLHTAHTKTYSFFFGSGLVETSWSDQKWLIEPEKDNLNVNQTKWPLFLKCSEYVKLYGTFTLLCFRARCTGDHLDWNVFCYNVCWCCLPGYIVKQQYQCYVFPV